MMRELNRGPGRPFRAGYVGLARRGELAERARALDALLADCTVCPRECRVDRRSSLGTCATGADTVVASYNLHFGEEWRAAVAALGRHMAGDRHHVQG